MAVYYTNEKAKFGGTSGTIIPFTIKLPSTNFPNIGDWTVYVPAGYLRCDGSIYRSELFPSLAAILGTGRNCTFAKNPDTLQEGFFQLPDLGSKVVRPSRSSGEYFNDTVLQNDAGEKRVGAETVVETLVGDEVTITYTGEFTVEQSDAINFLGNPFFLAEDNDGRTFASQLNSDNFQPHGHDSDVAVFTYTGVWQDSGFTDTGERGDNQGRTEGSNELVTVQNPEGSSQNPSHTHDIDLPTSTELRNASTFRFYHGQTPIEPNGLETTVTLTTANVTKLDKATSPYIFVEYLIKI